MREAPSKILLIVAPSHHAARAWAKEAGLVEAMALGHLRVVTRAAGLRGWRFGTLVTAVGWLGNEDDFSEVNDVLSALWRAGNLRAVTREDLGNFRREVLA